MLHARTACAAAALAITALALPAHAHVTVNPNTATKGGFAKLSFRVPTEKGIDTTKLVVQFPAEHPIPFVSVRPRAGWTYAVQKRKLATPISGEGEDITEAVSQITWSGGKIGPGKFDEFDVSVGPLPEDADELVFKALQTYSDGSVVRWIELRTGSDEPEHPAPVLRLTAAAGSSPSPAASGASVSASPVSGSTTESASESDVRTAKRTSVAGLVVGGIAAVLALAALVAGRRTA